MIVPRVVKKCVTFTNNVADYVRRRGPLTYNRFSPVYEPGKYACREGYEWCHPSRLRRRVPLSDILKHHPLNRDSDPDCDPDDTTDEENPEDEFSDGENSKDLNLGNVDSKQLRAGAWDTQNINTEETSATEHGFLVDDNPLAVHNETRIKRRRLNDRGSALLSEHPHETEDNEEHNDMLSESRVHNLSLVSNLQTSAEVVRTGIIDNSTNVRPRGKDATEANEKGRNSCERV